jgi:hypothetical protein
VQVQVGSQRLAVLRSFGEFSELAEFNGAEKGLRAPEAKAQLHDFVGSKLLRHKFRLREFSEFEQGNSMTGEHKFPLLQKNSLPQLGQVRWGSVLMDLTVLWRNDAKVK